jgi:hypothetical protein
MFCCSTLSCPFANRPPDDGSNWRAIGSCVQPKAIERVRFAHHSCPSAADKTLQYVDPMCPMYESTRLILYWMLQPGRAYNSCKSFTVDKRILAMWAQCVSSLKTAETPRRSPGFSERSRFLSCAGIPVLTILFCIIALTPSRHRLTSNPS